MNWLKNIEGRGAASLAGGAFAIALCAPAGAADIPPGIAKAPMAAVWSWSGYYAGLNLGGGFGGTTGDYVTSQGFAQQVTDGTIPLTLGLKPGGVAGGGQFGHNWQNGSFLFGIEADLQASNVVDSVTIIRPPAGVSSRTISNGHERLEWFGSARARLGVVPTGRALYYITGGLAYGGVHSRANICFPLFNGICDGDNRGALKKTRVGYTLGGGAEYKWSDRWSLKLEYLYLDLGRDTVRLTDPIFPADSLDYRFSHRDHIVRVGLNYKLK